MNVAPLQFPLPSGRSQPIADSRVARVALFDDLSDAEPHWRALERQNALATPYQQYEFLSLWHRHVGLAAGVEPLIAVGFDVAHYPVFLWPLGRRRIGSYRVAEFLGGKHSNFNLGLWNRHLATTITEPELRMAVAEFARRDVDALLLRNQPLTWQGTTNPFALLKNHPAPDNAYSGALIADFDALLRARVSASTRKKMRKKERTLAEFGALRFQKVDDVETARSVLDVFFKQKAARMHMLGQSDNFAEPGVRRFIEAVVTGRIAHGAPTVELYALWVGNLIVATMGGIVSDNRFCGMLNSIIQDRFTGESPGEQLILRLIRSCCERGLTAFDLGIGLAAYKGAFCPDSEPLFDNFIPLTPAGRLIAFGAQSLYRAKRVVKHSAILWKLAGALRRLHRRSNIAI